MKLLYSLLIPGIFLVCAGAQEPNTPPKASGTREVRIHMPPGTKIVPGDKVTPAKLVKKVNPVYPPLARQTRISGTVRFHVTITTDGNVEDLELISGHPLLVQSAMDAVHQWRYDPTQVNGKPVEVDTTIDVIFSLDVHSGDNTSGPSATSQPTTKTEEDKPKKSP